MGQFSITYPWPDYRLSANGRGGRRLIARLTKQVRTQAANETHNRGYGPMRQAIPVVVTSHPPSNRWDKDNARQITKPVIDGIADAMGANDKEYDFDPVVGASVKGGAIVVTFEEIPG